MNIARNFCETLKEGGYSTELQRAFPAPEITANAELVVIFESTMSEELIQFLSGLTTTVRERVILALEFTPANASARQLFEIGISDLLSPKAEFNTFLNAIIKTLQVQRDFTGRQRS